MDLTVVTATCQRPQFLAHCLRQFQMQSLGGLKCEHIVVSDGPDERAKFLADRSGARYSALPKPVGQWGAGAKDLGIQSATGKYICFWDDDNIYDSHALTTLYAAVQNADIGVVRTQHHLRKTTGVVTIPRKWDGIFQVGDIDTMCLCVRKELAKRETWQSQDAQITNDYDWLMKLQRHQPKINYLPIIIGEHV